jgi:hypothetical protein
MPPKKKEVEEKAVLMGRLGTNLRCGIVGLPNVGKSTFFNVLTKTQIAAAENFPFCTIDPNENKYQDIFSIRVGELTHSRSFRTRSFEGGVGWHHLLEPSTSFPPQKKNSQLPRMMNFLLQRKNSGDSLIFTYLYVHLRKYAT